MGVRVGVGGCSSCCCSSRRRRSCSAVTIRVVAFQSLDLTNLVWNLFLAWIPFVLALAPLRRARGARRRRRRCSRSGASGCVFLPNAPYIATDLIWLGDLPSGTHWHDPILVRGRGRRSGSCSGSCRSTSCRPSSRSGSDRVAGWTVAMAALVLSGLGVYLGRYERWNSWEVLTEPGKIFGGLASGLADPHGVSEADRHLGVLRGLLLRRLRRLLLALRAAPAPPRRAVALPAPSATTGVGRTMRAWS